MNRFTILSIAIVVAWTLYGGQKADAQAQLISSGATGCIRTPSQAGGFGSGTAPRMETASNLTDDGIVNYFTRLIWPGGTNTLEYPTGELSAYYCSFGRLSTFAPASVFVDLRVIPPSTAQCWVTARDFNGTPLWTSASQSRTNSGFLQWNVPTDVLGYMNVVCRLYGTPTIIGFNVQ